MTITYTRGVLGVAAWALVSLPALAQHDGQHMPSPGPSASSASPASCAQSSQAVTRGIDALVGRIDEARQTNDAAKMRATVGDLQVALAQMKTELAECAALTQASGAMGNMAAIDHSRMQMPSGAPVIPPSSPAAADTKTAPPMADMDHSKMQMPPKSGAASRGTKTAAPMAGMDHSNMTDEKTAPAPTVLFALRTHPAPPRGGKNDFEVTLKDANGKPIADADVSLEFSMPVMPSMKVPEVRLTSAGNGSYKGSATMGMAGDWDVTVKASRNGQPLDVKKIRLTAK